MANEEVRQLAFAMKSLFRHSQFNDMFDSKSKTLVRNYLQVTREDLELNIDTVEGQGVFKSIFSRPPFREQFRLNSIRDIRTEITSLDVSSYPKEKQEFIGAMILIHLLILEVMMSAVIRVTRTISDDKKDEVPKYTPIDFGFNRTSLRRFSKFLTMVEDGYDDILAKNPDSSDVKYIKSVFNRLLRSLEV